MVVLVLFLTLSACGNNAEPARLGTSDFSIVYPEGYALAEDDVCIVELCFWTIDTAEEYKAVDETINTLKKN